MAQWLMAAANQQHNTTLPLPVPSNDSDYGSDIDDATAETLFSQSSATPLPGPPITKAAKIEVKIEEPVIVDEDAVPQDLSMRLARVQHSLDELSANSARIEQLVRSRRRNEAVIEIEYEERNRGAFAFSNPEDASATRDATPTPAPVQQQDDQRSPLERFRSTPRKLLKVSDFVAPAWCEQKYHYSLHKHGRIRQTAAMKQGSSVHKVLEEQVHVEVPVEVVSKEDGFGLQVWNTIQGLRTLRATGLTRELKVWGVLEGEVVIGVIDEVTVECPDGGMEARLRDGEEGGEAKGSGKKNTLAPDQRTLEQFLTGSQGGTTLENNPAFLGTLNDVKDSPPTYYIKDIKTTKAWKRPTYGYQTRPVHIQLMLYRRLLSSLAANEVPAEKVFTRLALDSEARFSDAFLAALSNFDTNPPDPSQGEDAVPEPLAYNTLALLWTLLLRELQTTFPRPSTSTHPSISPVLAATYHSTSRDDAVIGTLAFPDEPENLDAFVKEEMRWWRGERKPIGVSVDEAFKCAPRMCDFSEECEWRKTKVEEGLRRAKLKKEGVGIRSGI